MKASAIDSNEAVSELIEYEGKVRFEFSNRGKADEWAEELSEECDVKVHIEDTVAQDSDGGTDGNLISEIERSS